jgi:hypothetical protein
VATVNASVLDRAGNTIQYSANGGSLDDAKALMKAKLNLIVGTVTSISYTEPIGIPEAMIVSGGAPTSFVENIALTLRRGTIVNGKVVSRTVQILSANDIYKEDGTNRGKVNVAHADILAFAGTFMDSDGKNDYTVHSGQYSKKFSRRGVNLSRR